MATELTLAGPPRSLIGPNCAANCAGPNRQSRPEHEQAAANTKTAKSQGNKLTAMMVVRNEADRFLVPVLDDLTQWVDEIVILDDASTDSTPDICRSYAKVVKFQRNSYPGLWSVRFLKVMLPHQTPRRFRARGGDQMVVWWPLRERSCPFRRCLLPLKSPWMDQ
ncbi:MAG TPA: glycosyltransferase [Firmicutes bacterium]|nr:glycosyltransferase [Bacillota bacterium]